VRHSTQARLLLFRFYLDDEKTRGSSFLEGNTWCGERIRQSGAFGNDLYVKNFVVFRGTLKGVEKMKGSDKKKRGRREEEEEIESSKKKKKKASKGKEKSDGRKSKALI
jgi:hypothetical protein